MSVFSVLVQGSRSQLGLCVNAVGNRELNAIGTLMRFNCFTVYKHETSSRLALESVEHLIPKCISILKQVH